LIRSIIILIAYSLILTAFAQTNKIIVGNKSISSPPPDYNVWYAGITTTGDGSGDSRANQIALGSFNQAVIQPGDHIWLDDALYTTASISISKSGTPGNFITWETDPNEPGQAHIRNMSIGISIQNDSYIYFKNIKITNCGTGLRIDDIANVIVFDSLYLHNNEYMYWAYGGCGGIGAGANISSCSGIDSIWIIDCYAVQDSQVNGQWDLFSAYGGQNNVFLIGNYIANLNTAGDTPDGQHVDCIQFSNYTGNIFYGNNFLKNICNYNSQIMMNGDSWNGYTSRFYNNVLSYYGVGIAQWAPTHEWSCVAGDDAPGQDTVINNTFVGKASLSTTEGTHFDYQDTLFYWNNIASVADDCGPLWITAGVTRVQDACVPTSFVTNTLLPGTSFDYNLYHVAGESGVGPRVFGQSPTGCNTLTGWRTHTTSPDVNGISPSIVGFTDQINDNFSLIAGSAALNAGTDLESVITNWNIRHPVTGVLLIKWETFNNPYISWSNPVPRDATPSIGAW